MTIRSNLADTCFDQSTLNSLPSPNVLCKPKWPWTRSLSNCRIELPKTRDEIIVWNLALSQPFLCWTLFFLSWTRDRVFRRNCLPENSNDLNGEFYHAKGKHPTDPYRYPWNFMLSHSSLCLPWTHIEKGMLHPNSNIFFQLGTLKTIKIWIY